MLNQIVFTINKGKLIEILKFLSPFIVPQKKEDVEVEEESDIVLPEPYFYDKVTFSLYKTHACLFVLTKEGVRVSRTCHIDSEFMGISFCMPHAYLLQELEKKESICYVVFKEDRFFGFDVFDSISGKQLFEINAHSVSKQPSVHPKFFDTLYPHTVGLEHDTFIKVLKEFPKYTTNNSLKPYTEDIWFYIKNGACRVIACSGSQLRQEVFPTQASGFHVFSISGKGARRISDMVENWTDDTFRQIGYNNTYLSIYHFNRTGRYGETVELPLCKTELPSLQSILEKRNITYHSSVYLKEFQSALRMINKMNYKGEYMLMHFFPDHINLFNQEKYFDKSVYNFIDADNGDGEHIIKLHQKDLEAILEEIYTDKILFTLVDDSLLYIRNEDEPLFGDFVRILCTAKLQDDDLELLGKGDKSLNSHQTYIKKYLTEHEDDSPEAEYATIDEMKEEALCRMKEVIDYTDIIDYFEGTGLPQVYEPPYGASYSLEDDELENIRKIESSRHILVWGVIRCFMLYNKQEVTVDCMLHVSQYKDEWEQEREDLRKGLPYVYTVMKEYPVTDNGHINVYKSEGGTLLRK